MKIVKGNNKSLLQNQAYDIFSLTYDLMQNLVRVNSKDQDYLMRKKNFSENKDLKYILLYNNEDELRGYIEYKLNVNEKEIYIGQLMISPKYQFDGKTLFHLTKPFMHDINNDFITVLASTNKANLRMQNLFIKIGFMRYSETKRQYRYIISKDKLLSYFKQNFIY